MLHSKDVNQQFQDHRYLSILVRKNRDGRLGQVNYTYVGDYVNFIETKYNIDTKNFDIVEQESFDKIKPTVQDTVQGIVQVKEGVPDLPF